MELASLIIASLTLVVTFTAALLAIIIYKKQAKEQEYAYIISKVLQPIAKIEGDILMLIDLNGINYDFTKKSIDIFSLTTLSEAKSYCLIHSNKRLFDELNIIEKNHYIFDLATLIEDYFVVRGEFIMQYELSQNNETTFDENGIIKKHLWVFLDRTRETRNSFIDKYVS